MRKHWPIIAISSSDKCLPKSLRQSVRRGRKYKPWLVCRGQGGGLTQSVYLSRRAAIPSVGSCLCSLGIDRSLASSAARPPPSLPLSLSPPPPPSSDSHSLCSCLAALCLSAYERPSLAPNFKGVPNLAFTELCRTCFAFFHTSGDSQLWDSTQWNTTCYRVWNRNNYKKKL